MFYLRMCLDSLDPSPQLVVTDVIRIAWFRRSRRVNDLYPRYNSVKFNGVRA